MLTKTIIQADERGLLFTKGSYTKLLQPGVYRSFVFSDQQITVLSVSKPFAVPGKELALFLHDELLLRELEIVQVQDHEHVLHYEDGKFTSVLTAGKYAFWNVLKQHRFVHVDTRLPELPANIDAAVLPKLAAHCQVVDVASYETGMLFVDHVMQRELSPGRYYFWKGPSRVAVYKVDLRQLQIDLTGQEMMTEDKVTLRLNFVCQYKVVEPLRALEIKLFEEQIYIQLQLILREYVGTMKLDDLLRMKHEIAPFVLSRLSEKSGEFGIEFLSAGVKDIILPGEIKEILNTVLLAEKKAQANLITRREETASTRSLLNTAKLMEDNQTLFRLKELEFLEKICDKIGTISLTGGGSLLEQLNSLLKKTTD
ncbi:slipin family protein [Paenibacillaceae bacterium]|nr:slipin family protein [Paenibacillaceae bacterium]